MNASGFRTAAELTPRIEDRSSLELVPMGRPSAGHKRPGSTLIERLGDFDAMPNPAAPDHELRGLARGENRHDVHVRGQFERPGPGSSEPVPKTRPCRLPQGQPACAPGVAALRRGETDNCIACCTDASCIFPLARAAVHQQTAGSRQAIRHFTAYLEKRPEDIGVRWLLNIAYMTLGEYPEKVPARASDPLEPFRSKIDVGRFRNVAARVGLDAAGENNAGGCIVDDFNGDGLLDVFTSNLDPERGPGLFINRGDGMFEERSAIGRPGRPGRGRQRDPRRLRQRRRPRCAAVARRMGAGQAALTAAQPGRRHL